jgi:hypothetical protein
MVLEAGAGSEESFVCLARRQGGGGGSSAATVVGGSKGGARRERMGRTQVRGFWVWGPCLGGGAWVVALGCAELVDDGMKYTWERCIQTVGASIKGLRTIG